MRRLFWEIFFFSVEILISNEKFVLLEEDLKGVENNYEEQFIKVMMKINEIFCFEQVFIIKF